MKSFFDLFPTPKFLEMPSPGLALSDSGLKFIEFSTGPEGMVVKRYGSALFPAGLIENGVILDEEAFAHALKNFRKSFDLHYIRTTIPEERAYLYETTIPKVSDKDMRTAVEATLEENVPISVAEAVFDYVMLPDRATGKDEVRVSVSVIAEAVVMEFLELYRKAGFMPLHFDVESQAVAKAVVPKHDPSTVLVISIDPMKTTFSIVSLGAVAFASTMNSSMGNDFVALDAEIKKIFLYWQSEGERQGEKISAIEHIIVCGGMKDLGNAVDHIGKTFGVKAALGNVWVNAFSLDRYVPPITLDESLGYASAIGLALSHH